MTIIRCDHDEHSPFVMVNRCTAQNKALSYEALGMLTYLLSQADDWVVGVDDLIREACGRDKAYRILKELTEAGHLVHERVGVGQHKPPVWAERTVHEQPLTPSTKSVKAVFGEANPPVPEKADLANTSEPPPNPEKADTVKSSLTHTSAGAAKQILKSLNTQEPEQVLKDKSVVVVGDNAGERAKIFDQYTALTKRPIESKLVVDQLQDDAEAYPADWIDDAVTQAALNGVTTWNYVRKALQARLSESKDTSRPASVKGARVNGNANFARGSPTPNPPPIPLTSPGVPLPRKAVP